MSPMTKLSVNVNKVALLRNTRTGEIPSVVKFARIALDAGAHGITVHPRPDQRHIRPGDVDAIASLLGEPPHAEAEFNIEGNPFIGDYVEHARRVRPDQCTLVPDSPEQATSDHGWDVAGNFDRLCGIVETLHATGARVSLFMDPDPVQIERVPATGADRIELYTESYANAYAAGGSAFAECHERFKHAAEVAHGLGLKVNAGHDLNLDNLPMFATIANIAEVSIGHALIADALEMGMAGAVRAYLRCLLSDVV
jgi:pyridoxine 5-phosphate synthase